MSLALSSPKAPVAGPPPVVLQNPIGEDFSVVRSGLLGGVLGILGLNKHRELPQRVFEIGDVVIDGTNVRRLGAASIHPKASFTEMKSLVQSLLRGGGEAGGRGRSCSARSPRAWSTATASPIRSRRSSSTSRRSCDPPGNPFIGPAR